MTLFDAQFLKLNTWDRELKNGSVLAIQKPLGNQASHNIQLPLASGRLGMLEPQAQLGLSEQSLPQSLISDTQTQVNLRNRLTGKLKMEREPEA